MIRLMENGYKFWGKHCGYRALVRVVHTFLCLAITGTLLWKDTYLRVAIIEKKDLVYGGFFLCLLFISVSLYHITSLTDPGYVDIVEFRKTRTVEDAHTSESEQSDIEAPAADIQPLDKRNRYKYRYCDYCEIKPPLRSKHCKDCQLCVRRFDHHCPWLEACIGERNHRYFWWFLLVTATLILWTVYIVWESFITQDTWSDWFHKNLVLFLDMVVLVWSGPVTVGLVIFHTYLMMNGLTTWEAASRQSITYLKYLEGDTNPFDDGCCRNMYFFMCFCHIRKWETVYTNRAKYKDSEA